MGKLYYTLVQRINGKWSPQFGDYTKSTVTFERRDYRDQGIPAKDLAIIHSGDSREDVEAAVAQLN